MCVEKVELQQFDKCDIGVQLLTTHIITPHEGKGAFHKL